MKTIIHTAKISGAKYSLLPSDEVIYTLTITSTVTKNLFGGRYDFWFRQTAVATFIASLPELVSSDNSYAAFYHNGNAHQTNVRATIDALQYVRIKLRNNFCATLLVPQAFEIELIFTL